MCPHCERSETYQWHHCIYLEPPHVYEGHVDFVGTMNLYKQLHKTFTFPRSTQGMNPSLWQHAPYNPRGFGREGLTGSVISALTKSRVVRKVMSSHFGVRARTQQ